VETQSVTAPNATARIEKVQISAPLNVGIQNDSVQNAVTPNAMDVPAVRSYRDAMASMAPRFVVHYAATRTSMVPNATAQNEKVQISVPRTVEIQNDSAQNAVTLNATDVPVVRSYRDAMDEMVAHYAVTHFALELHFVAAALRYVVVFRPLEMVHFFAVAVQTLASVIHSAQVAPVQFVHDRASVSRPSLSLCLDRYAPDDLHRCLALPVS
jgi:hypothetical protein